MGNSKAIWSKNILTRGKALIGKWGATDRATVKQAVHDGDTVNIELDGNVGIRFLGIDTPEISYQFPGRDTFLKIDPHFVDYLTDPFSDDYPESDRLVNDLTADLVEYLEDRLGP